MLLLTSEEGNHTPPEAIELLEEKEPTEVQQPPVLSESTPVGGAGEQ